MKKLFPTLMIIGLLVTGCANWMDNDDFPAFPDSVTLSHHELTMLVGDTCQLSAIFSPEDYYEQTLLWISTDDDIVSVNANSLMAKSVGECNIAITSAIGLKTDTCRVKVKPAWGNVRKDMYDMVVYADVDHDLYSQRIELGAFWGEELRGRGELREHNGVKYAVFRVYSPLLSSEELKVPITFRCHLRDQGRVVQYLDTIYFDGEAHGSLSNLYKLTFTDN